MNLSFILARFSWEWISFPYLLIVRFPETIFIAQLAFSQGPIPFFWEFLLFSPVKLPAPVRFYWTKLTNLKAFSLVTSSTLACPCHLYYTVYVNICTSTQSHWKLCGEMWSLNKSFKDSSRRGTNIILNFMAETSANLHYTTPAYSNLVTKSSNNSNRYWSFFCITTYSKNLIKTNLFSKLLFLWISCN